MMQHAKNKQEFVKRLAAQLGRLMPSRKFIEDDSTVFETTSQTTIILHGEFHDDIWTMTGIRIYKLKLIETVYKYHDYHEARYPSLPPEATAIRIVRFIRESLKYTSRKSQKAEFPVWRRGVPVQQKALPPIEPCKSQMEYPKRLETALALLFPNEKTEHNSTSVIFQNIRLEIFVMLGKTDPWIGWECIGVRYTINNTLISSMMFELPILLPEKLATSIKGRVESYISAGLL